MSLQVRWVFYQLNWPYTLPQSQMLCRRHEEGQSNDGPGATKKPEFSLLLPKLLMLWRKGWDPWQWAGALGGGKRGGEQLRAQLGGEIPGHGSSPGTNCPAICCCPALVPSRWWEKHGPNGPPCTWAQDLCSHHALQRLGVCTRVTLATAPGRTHTNDFQHRGAMPFHVCSQRKGRKRNRTTHLHIPVTEWSLGSG